MPGAMEHVEGVIAEVDALSTPQDYHFDVDGLQEILEKFVGKRVSIIVEEVEE